MCALSAMDKQRPCFSHHTYLCSGAGEKVFVVLNRFFHVVLLEDRVVVVEHVCDARHGFVVLAVTLGLIERTTPSTEGQRRFAKDNIGTSSHRSIKVLYRSPTASASVILISGTIINHWLPVYTDSSSLKAILSLWLWALQPDLFGRNQEQDPNDTNRGSDGRRRSGPISGGVQRCFEHDQRLLRTSHSVGPCPRRERKTKASGGSGKKNKEEADSNNTITPRCSSPAGYCSSTRPQHPWQHHLYQTFFLCRAIVFCSNDPHTCWRSWEKGASQEGPLFRADEMEGRSGVTVGSTGS